MKFLKNIKIAKKIGFLSISLLIFILAIGFVGIKQISVINSNVRELNNSRLIPILNIENAKAGVVYIETQMNSIMGAQGTDAVKTYEDNISTRVTKIDEILSKYKNDMQYKDLFDKYNTLLTTKDVMLNFQKNRVSNSNNDAVTSSTGGPPVELLNFQKAQADLIEVLDNITEQQANSAQQTYSNSESEYNITVSILITLLIACLIVALFLSFIITRSTVMPIKRVTNKLKEISEIMVI